MIPVIRNLFEPAQKAERSRDEETFPLLDVPHASHLKLEHLVSHGQASPPGFWYDQPGDEWVVLLRGAATLDFESGASTGSLDLVAGDSLTIAARLRHRVASVSPDAVWLALHFDTRH